MEDLETYVTEAQVAEIPEDQAHFFCARRWVKVIGSTRLPTFWTPPGSPLGKGTCGRENANLIVLVQSEVPNELALDPTSHCQPILVVDDGMPCMFPGSSAASAIQEFISSIAHCNTIDVQNPSLPYGEAVQQWPVTDLASRFSNTSWSLFDDLPINCLDISSRSMQQPGWLLDRRHHLLQDVIEYMREEQPLHVGKSHQETLIASDMSKCTRFQLLAQRGAISLPHHDHHGVSKWVKVVQGLKAWVMWDGDADLDDFAGKGVSFQGVDPFLVLLQPGQTLIMRRPITIHSPATAKDTLMDCGCFWRYDAVLQFYLEHDMGSRARYGISSTPTQPTKTPPFSYFRY